MFRCSAVIIDTRGGPAFQYVVNNILVNLPKAEVVWYHDQHTNVSDALKLISDNRRVKLREFQLDGRFTLDTYNYIVTQPGFYKGLQEEILMFQPDSCFEKISLQSLEEFRKYDYVGAPWEQEESWVWHGEVGNGGFSYRKKSAILKCLRERPYEKDVYEDVYFGVQCKHLINVCPAKVARRFSYEMNNKYKGALGFHKVWAYQGAKTNVTKELAGLQ